MLSMTGGVAQFESILDLKLCGQYTFTSIVMFTFTLKLVLDGPCFSAATLPSLVKLQYQSWSKIAAIYPILHDQTSYMCGNLFTWHSRTYLSSFGHPLSRISEKAHAKMYHFQTIQVVNNHSEPKWGIISKYPSYSILVAAFEDSQNSLAC